MPYCGAGTKSEAPRQSSLLWTWSRALVCRRAGGGGVVDTKRGSTRVSIEEVFVVCPGSSQSDGCTLVATGCWITSRTLGGKATSPDTSVPVPSSLG
eukprot:6508398-Prymnesium_polylepis.1